MNILINTKVKYLFDNIFKGANPKYEESSTEYIILGQRNNSKKGIDFNECKFTNQYFFETRSSKEFLRYGDILINSLGGGTCGRVGFYNIKNQKILSDGIPFILRNEKNNKYLFYLLKSKQNILEDIAIGATNQVSLKDFDLLNLQVAIIPDQNEQKLIADFLDIKCAEIDGITKDLQTQIETLENYKKSVITEAVTKGLNPNVEMKNSGISYVGKIPNGWDIRPVYYFFNEGKKRNYGCKENNLLSLSYGNIIRKDINSNGGLLPASFSTYNIVERNDIIIRPTDLQNDKHSLRTGLVNEHGIITSAYIDLVPKKKVNSSYYHYLLHSYDVMKVFYNMGNGVRQGLNYSEFSKLLVLQPSFEEQKEIANYLDKKCAEIEEIIKNKKEQLETIEEYKKSLIYEYVTGKKEVKNA